MLGTIQHRTSKVTRQVVGWSSQGHPSGTLPCVEGEWGGAERGGGGEKGVGDKLQDDGVVFCTRLVVVHFTADWRDVSII